MTDRPHEYEPTPPNQAPGSGPPTEGADVVDLATARAGRLPHSTQLADIDNDAPVTERPESARRTTARDTSYELELDEPPTVDDAAPVLVDLPESATPAVPPVEGRRPVIPTGLHRALPPFGRRRVGGRTSPPSTRSARRGTSCKSRGGPSSVCCG